VRFLITGGGGFIGHNLIDWLTGQPSCEIRVLDNFSTGKREHLDNLNLDVIAGDIRDSNTVSKAMVGIDTVIHLAADTRVVNSIENPNFNFDVNVLGTLNLLSAAKENDVGTFVFASTGGAILGNVEPPVHEAMLPRPIAPYGASKLAGEAYCSAFSGAYGLKTIALRFSNVYGPYSYHKGSVIAHFFNQLIRSQELIVYGNGEQTRDFVFVEDICDGIVRSLQSPHTGVYQLGTGIPLTINQLIQLIGETVQDLHGMKVRYVAPRSGEIHHTWCNISRAAQDLGYEPKTPIAEGLEITWRWFSTHLVSPAQGI